MATIRDVASRAGVSVTTVSHVVNTTRPVSAAVRARVDEAIRTLGYVPSAVARSLKSNTTRTLGMLIPNSSNPYFAEIVRAVEDRCFASGYALILCNTDDAPERQSVYLTVLAERRIDGLIVVSTGDDDALVAQLHGLKMPTVLLDREIGDPGCDMFCRSVDGLRSDSRVNGVDFCSVLGALDCVSVCGLIPRRKGLPTTGGRRCALCGALLLLPILRFASDSP